MQVLFATTLFLSAALLFLVEPLLGRLVLPRLGGAPAVWNTCMLFFQAVLLLGTAYAHAVPAWLGLRRHALLHLGVLLLPLLVLPLRPPPGWDEPGQLPPVWWLITFLFLAAGLPFFAVATTSPLLQRWFAGTTSPAAHDPYFLYAASNLGSVLGLLAYPFVLEPMLSLPAQGVVWQAGYFLLLALVAVCAVCLWWSPGPRDPGPKPTHCNGWACNAGAAQLAKPTAARRLRWVVLAFVPSSLMLSVTAHLTTDVAPVPLLWVAPLTLYLLSFVVAFARKPPLSRNVLRRWAPLVVLPVILTLMSEGAELPPLLQIALHLLGFFWLSCLCHAELAADRPLAPARQVAEQRLAEFYFWLALGGTLGGAFNALLAPLLFATVAEYPLILVLACLLRSAPNEPEALATGPGERRGVSPPVPSLTLPARWAGTTAQMLDLALPVGLGVLTVALGIAVQAAGVNQGPASFGLKYGLPLVLCYTFTDRPLRFGLATAALLLAAALSPGVYGRTEYRLRSFFAVHRVTRDPTGHFRRLVHGDTVHGAQSLDPEKAREPLTYYARTGPAGLLLKALDWDDPERCDPRLRRVGLVGLGTGALCCYASPGQHWTFFEIDPAVKYLACDSGLFTYYPDCRARCEVVLGDARLSLQRSDERFGVLFVDAFSSDAIPAHLLTTEALDGYRARLTEDGILAFHISNRFLDLEKVLCGLARDAGMACIAKEERVLTDQELESGKAPSHWVILARDQDALRKVLDTGRWREVTPKKGAVVWRDNYSNLLGVLKWHVFAGQE